MTTGQPHEQRCARCGQWWLTTHICSVQIGQVLPLPVLTPSAPFEVTTTDKLTAERDALRAWIDTANQSQRNCEFYMGLIDACAAAIGTAAYTADDGTVMESPVRLVVPELVQQLVDERNALRAEVERLRAACSRENDTISQVLGRALGYPRFADDQKNFPGATDADGVCVGDHVAASLADEAADCIRTLRSEITAERDAWRRENAALANVLYLNGFRRCDVPACNCGSWHHRFGLPERMTEIKDALTDAGHPLSNDNGNKPLNALAGLVSERDALRAEVERLRADLPAAYQRGYTEALNDCIRNGGEQWARSMFADGGDAIDAARAAQEGKT